MPFAPAGRIRNKLQAPAAKADRSAPLRTSPREPFGFAIKLH